MIQRRKIFGLLFSFTALVAVAAKDEPTQPIILPPAQAAKEGRALVDEILSATPAASATTGTMEIRTRDNFTKIPIKFETTITSTNWLSDYQTFYADHVEHLLIGHTANQANNYSQFGSALASAGDQKIHVLAPGFSPVKDIWAPFVKSDFSIADLGLEFLHWPDQRLLQKEMKRSRSCRVLESINPHPEPGGYSRVKSWVDAESHGILYAEAYDMGGKKIKEFYPKDFDKVDGQWQLHEMQISNLQTDSRTTVKFNLEK